MIKPSNRYFLLAGSTTGILIAMQYLQLAHYFNLHGYEALIPRYIILTLIGLVAGYVITCSTKVQSAYKIALFGVLFAGAIATLLTFTKTYSLVLYGILIVAGTSATFVLSGRFFRSSWMSDRVKFIIASIACFVWSVLCAGFGLYISRIITS